MLGLTFYTKKGLSLLFRVDSLIIIHIVRMVLNHNHTNKFFKEKQKELLLFYSNHCHMGKDDWRNLKGAAGRKTGCAC